MASTMIHALPVLGRIAAVAASIGLRSTRGDRAGKGHSVPALDLAAIAPRLAEARDLLAYLNAAGVAQGPPSHESGGRGTVHGAAEVIAIAAHAGRRGRHALGARSRGSKAEIVPLRHDA